SSPVGSEIESVDCSLRGARSEERHADDEARYAAARGRPIVPVPRIVIVIVIADRHVIVNAVEVASIRAITAAIACGRPIAPGMIVPALAMSGLGRVPVTNVGFAMILPALACAMARIEVLSAIPLLLDPLVIARSMSIVRVGSRAQAQTDERTGDPAHPTHPRCRCRVTHSNLLMLSARASRSGRCTERVLNLRSAAAWPPSCVLSCRGSVE